MQIINISNSHWVCASNISCPTGVVDVYDSIPQYSMGSYSLQKELAAILCTKEKTFTIRYVNVQRQSGGSDCGLYAIAFAFLLCSGNDPHMVALLQTHMRRHLASCINERQFTNFPEGRKHRVGRRRYREKSEVVSVYCVCRQPWARSVQSCGALVQCSQCKEWFHQACEGIDKDVLMQSKDFLWFCSQCNYS